MGFILFLIALIFTTIFTVIWAPISMLYHIFTLKWKSGIKEINLYFYQLAIIIDVFANESLQTAMNFTMIKGENKFLFGNDDRDTLSYIIAINERRGTLTRFGRFWAWFLDFVDKDHLKKAIEFKEDRYQNWESHI